MPLQTILPNEYASVIDNTQAGWQPFIMANNNIVLNPGDRIDDVSALPTPWARMQFVNMAFKKWQGNTALEANLTDEEKKVINYTFDLLELVFFQNFYTKKLEFKSVPEFNEDNLFTRATNIFFDFPQPTLIKIRTDNAYSLLIGSTSPYTLVYPAYHRIKESYPMGENRKLFDQKPSSIDIQGTRPSKFLSFLRLIAETLPNVDNHPTQSFKQALLAITNNSLTIPINELRTSEESNQDTNLEIHHLLEAHNVQNDILTVAFANHEVLQLRSLSSECVFQSDYFYHDNKIIVGNFNTNHEKYLKNFPLKINTSLLDIKNLDRNVLPNTIIRQVWLHESDFFTPTLIKMPYKLNGDSFYLGIQNDTFNELFALPLTNLYFENLNHWDEMNIPDYDTSLSIKNVHGKYKAEVKVLLNNGKPINVTKTYESKEINKDIENSNWSLKVFPNFYISNYKDSIYNEAALDQKIDIKTIIGEMPYWISLFEEAGIPAKPIRTIVRFYDKMSMQFTEDEITFQPRQKKLYSFLNSFVNYKVLEIPQRIEIILEVGANREQLIFNLIPKFESIRYNYNQTIGLRIGFDFGTTNSVIAFKYTGANNQIKIANFNELKELSTFYSGEKTHEKDQNYTDVYSKYFIEPANYKKIFRSVINYSKGVSHFTDWVDFNVYLHPEISEIFQDSLNEYRTEFKWDINNPNYKGQSAIWVSHFITSNLLLLKYLLLQSQENMNLFDIQLIWFYPLAFDEPQLLEIRKIWQSKAKEIFVHITQPVELDESIAPFINSPYFSPINTNKILNIDIGGGTTDICLMKGITPEIKLSLPLAGRNILGDLYEEEKWKDPQFHNKVVWSLERPEITAEKKPQKSHEYFIKQPNEKKYEILRKGASIIWFFAFSILKYIKIIIESSNTSDSIEQNKLYPDTIRFSGNGSKMFELLLSNEKNIPYLQALKERTHSFNSFVDLIFGKNISIEFSESLKEDTVSGGVKYLTGNIAFNNSTSRNELIGENVNDCIFSDAIKNVQSNSAVEINSKGSYLIDNLLTDFSKLLEQNPQLFKMLFQSSSTNEIDKMKAYLNKQIQTKDYKKLQDYIAGGLENSGTKLSENNSSLLMFELQGIINEMTREI